jgi:acetyl esterase/lipase
VGARLQSQDGAGKRCDAEKKGITPWLVALGQVEVSPDQQMTAPPFDRELAALMVAAQTKPSTDLEQLIRNRSAPQMPTMEQYIAQYDLVVEDHSAPGVDGDPDVQMAVLRKRHHAPGGPGIYHVHGGGMVGGNRFTSIDRVIEWIDQFDCVAVSVEYRLAPEHPDPAPVNDCFAGLTWTAAHAAELGFDPGRLIIAGGSAGGGLAAGSTLMARDRGGPAIYAQVLISPMLDDRNDSVSSRQIDGVGVWDRTSNQTGWEALLGSRRGTDQVSIYAAPARATDYTGLPVTYIDCGSAEVFRDEDVAYALAIWAAGGAAELHVWSGAHHGFDVIFPGAQLSLLARRTRTEFMKRILHEAEGV